MESSDLRVFQMVAREGSITKAAARLGYVQSNVTARIRQLEGELGTMLFLRHNRGMTLSSSGKTLLTYADKVLGLLDEAAMALTAANEPSGPLLIGSSQTAAAVRLPKLMAAYFARYPKVHFSLSTNHTHQLMEKVLHYELDGAFIGSECTHPEVVSIPAFHEELVIASATSVSNLEEALERPILVLSLGCSYRDILERWLRSRSVTQSVIMEFGTLEAILGGVAAGLGISLLPRSVVGKLQREGLLRVHEIPETYRYMTTDFITRRDSFISSALGAFIEMIAPAEQTAGERPAAGDGAGADCVEGGRMA